MKKAILFFAAMSVLASCSIVENDIVTEEPKEDENLVTVTVGVKMDAATTKVVVGDSGLDKCLQWKDGDVISIGINNISDDSVAGQINTSVHVEGDDAYVSFSYNSAKYYITDARYPQGGTNATIPTTQYMWRGNVILPLTATYDGSQSDITFVPTIGDDYTIVQYRLQEGNVAKTLEAIEVTYDGGTKYTLDTKTKMGPGETNEGIGLTSTPQDFYVVIPSGIEAHELKAVFKMSDGTQYTRTKKTFTPTSKKLHTMPVLSDLDNTGKHIWYFGDNAVSSEVDAPLYYWFQQGGNGDYNADVVDVSNMVSAADHMTFKMRETSSGTANNYRSNLTIIRDKKYAVDYATSAVTTARSGLFPLYGTSNAKGQIPFVAVHGGNYPIFAVKMSNPVNYGTSRTFQVRVDARQTLDDVPLVTSCVDNIGNGANKQMYVNGTLGGNEYSSTSDIAIMYYDLSTQVIGSSKVLIPNTRVTPFNSWQIRFLNLTYAEDQAEAPEYDVYWAGFFNNVSELEAFAATH